MRSSYSNKLLIDCIFQKWNFPSHMLFQNFAILPQGGEVSIALNLDGTF